MSDAKLADVLSALLEETRSLEAAPSSVSGAKHRSIKLDTNENPFPLPLPVMQSAIAALKGHHLYPEDDNVGLREAAANAYGFNQDQVIAGNGSSELLSVIYKAFLAPGDSVAMLSPGFSFNRKLASLQGARFIEVKWDESYMLPMKQLLSGPAQDAKFIVLSNPNNPSGTFVPVADVDSLATQSNRLIVLDEAYVDFAPDDALRLVHRHPNLLVLRTFSKSYSAAGLRIGFGFGHPDLIGRLRNIQNLFNMNVIAHAVGISILSNRTAYSDNHKHIKEERERVTTALSHLGFSVIPSHANFLLARVPPGRKGTWWQTSLRDENIFIAAFPEDGLEDYIRVSIGKKDEMDAFISAAGRILKKLVPHETSVTSQ
ncbi:histidinol-phosphate aminotransferase [Rhizobium mesoamericanum]|nr:histidinol-phosphate transaminase [Rhizobium mesoamericanum]MDQ0561004.1 histidinol-phosphate aminotransferase [Rhizobium mesoamericanum]